MKRVAVILACIILSGCYETENGEKVGKIVKTGYQGFMFRTYECELIRGGMNGGSGAFGVQPFDFTVESKELFDKIKYAMEHDKEVRVKYHKEWATLARTETHDNSFVDEVEVIE